MNMKKLWRCAPKWVLPTILAAAVPFGASNVLAQAVEYESKTDGKWVGVNSTAFDYLDDYGYGNPSEDYRGHRWQVTAGSANPSRDKFDQTQNANDILDYPGSLSSGSSYAGVSGEVGDKAIIKHHIVLDMPFLGYGGYGKIGTLDIHSGGRLDINSFEVGAGTSVTNAGTLNVNGSHVHADGNGLINHVDAVVNVNNTSEITAVKVQNAGTIEITGSTDKIHADEFVNYISNGVTANGTLSLINSKVTFNDFDNGAGIIKLNNSELEGTDGQSGIQLADGHEIYVTGLNNTITGEVSADNELNIIGTDANSKVTLGAVNYTGTPTLSISKTQTSFDSTNLASVAAVNVGAESRIGGTGNAGTAFTFGSDSWLTPGSSPGTFAGESFDFTGGGFLFLEADFSAETYDKLIAEKGIAFSGGTTTVFVTKLNGDAGDEIDSVEFLKANNASGSDKITIDGSALDSSTMIGKADNVVTIENGDAKVIVQSAKDNAGNDAVTFGDVVATDTAFGFDKITATDVTPLDPSGPTPTPTPTPDPAPIQSSSNFETLRDVVNSMSANTNLNKAVGAAVIAAGGSQEAILEIISQLDPVALSHGLVYTEGAISGFNHKAFERIRLFDTNYGGAMRGQDACDPCEPIGCDPCDPCGFNGRGSSARQFWFQGIGGVVNQDDANGIAGYDTNMYGFALGADRKISRNTVVGFGFGNTYYDTDMNRGLGSANTKNYILSLYGGHKIGQWQLTGSVGYAMSELSSFRTASAINGWASSERDADSYFGSFELARRFGNDYGYFTPFLGYDFIGYNEDAFIEKGNHLAMSVQERDMDAYIQTLGARFGSKYVNRRGWIVNPGMTLGWIHDFGGGSVKTTGVFNEGGTPFTVVGTSRNKNRGLIGFNVDAALSNALTVFGRYDAELAEKYGSHTFQLGFAAQF